MEARRMCRARKMSASLFVLLWRPRGMGIDKSFKIAGGHSELTAKPDGPQIAVMNPAAYRRFTDLEKLSYLMRRKKRSA